MDLQLLENRRFTSLFGKSLEKCKNNSSLHNIFNLIKICVALVLLILSAFYRCGWQDVNTWMVLVMVQSIISFFTLFKLIDMLKKPSIILNVAEELHQVIYIGQEQPVEDMHDVTSFLANPLDDPTIELSNNEEEKKKLQLASQIKWEVTKQDNSVRYSGYSSFIMNQALLIWGFIIEISDDYWTSGEPCSETIQVYIYVFLFFTFFQYLDVYILTVFILICLPFFLIYLLYLKCKGTQQGIDTKKIINELKQKGLVKFKPDIFPGDPECGICMQTYQLNDNIIKLPCHESHNFHDYCLTTWLQINVNCPICRKDFSKQEEGTNLNNIES